jgi:hypothetical protein
MDFNQKWNVATLVLFVIIVVCGLKAAFSQRHSPTKPEPRNAQAIESRAQLAPGQRLH